MKAPEGGKDGRLVLAVSLNCLSAECSIESAAAVEKMEFGWSEVSIAFRLNARLKAGKVKDGELNASALSQLPFG